MAQKLPDLYLSYDKQKSISIDLEVRRLDYNFLIGNS